MARRHILETYYDLPCLLHASSLPCFSLSSVTVKTSVVLLNCGETEGMAFILLSKLQ